MHTSLPPRDAEQRSDAQLLAAYVAGGHCGPLAEVVRRHTPMVYAVARRVTNSAQDAEDIVQAVSMILVSQARKLLASPSIAGWLYQVARRAALDLRKSGARRQMRESQYARQRNPVANDRSNTAQQVDQETLQLLHDAISKLPPNYQEAVVLCHFERKTQQQAAIELGCSQRTISDRLYKASQLLHKILRRRGVTLSLAGVMALLAAEGAVVAATPPTVVAAGVAAAYAAAGQATLAAGAVSSIATALAKSVSAKMAFAHAAKTAATILAALVSVAAGTFGLYLWLKPSPPPVAAVAVAQKYPFDSRTQPNLSAMDIRNGGLPTTLPGWATSLDHFGTRLVGDSAGRTSPPARITRRIDGKPISSIEITASILGPFAADGSRRLPLNARLAGFTLVSAGGLDEGQQIPAPPAGQVRMREHHLRWVLTETEEGSGSWDVVLYNQNRLIQKFRATGQPADLGFELALQPGAMAWLRNMSVRGTALK
jgi:RNA polymerase sigma factor (sigma-70 family)